MRNCARCTGAVSANMMATLARSSRIARANFRVAARANSTSEMRSDMTDLGVFRRGYHVRSQPKVVLKIAFVYRYILSINFGAGTGS